MHKWIKLHVSLAEHAIMRDPRALSVFVYLLLRASKKGEVRVSRFVTSSEMGMKPTTFYDCLKRCASKYDLASLVTSGTYTTVYLKNWEKFQSLNVTSGDNSTSTRRQLTVTIRNKNKNKNKNKKGFNFEKENEDELIPQTDLRNTPEYQKLMASIPNLKVIQA